MWVRRCKRAFAYLAVAAALGVPAHGALAASRPAPHTPQVFTVPDYQACVAKVAQKPDDALEDAQVWSNQGGGLAAEHCAALAELALDRPGAAAMRLDAIARSAELASDDDRADILDQAGNAWLLAHQGAAAEADFTASLKFAPTDGDTWADRGRARAMLRHWAAAESDLTVALGYVGRPELFVFRAAARRALNRMKDARADIDSALKLDPRNADALVERGSLKLIAGDKQGARADWREVLTIAPDGAAGDEARRRIEDLEVNTSR